MPEASESAWQIPGCWLLSHQAQYEKRRDNGRRSLLFLGRTEVWKTAQASHLPWSAALWKKTRQFVIYSLRLTRKIGPSDFTGMAYCCFNYWSSDVNAGRDAYAGESNKEADLQEVEVRAKGYAEWLSKGCVAESAIPATTEKYGDVLSARLNALLNLETLPTLANRKITWSPKQDQFLEPSYSYSAVHYRKSSTSSKIFSFLPQQGIINVRTGRRCYSEIFVASRTISQNRAR